MIVIVDTPVWSEYYRRPSPRSEIVQSIRRLFAAGEASLLGCIRQEVLSGVKDPVQFDALRGLLRAVPDIRTHFGDYERASELSNTCRSRGIQGASTDFLVCAVAERLSAPIFTLDRDFEMFQRVLGIPLYPLTP